MGCQRLRFTAPKNYVVSAKTIIGRGCFLELSVTLPTTFSLHVVRAGVGKMIIRKRGDVEFPQKWKSPPKRPPFNSN